jgi:hypothetical protein
VLAATLACSKRVTEATPELRANKEAQIVGNIVNRLGNLPGQQECVMFLRRTAAPTGMVRRLG